MARRRSKAPQKPLDGPTIGPDSKGRFHLTIPETEKRLLFHGGLPQEEVRVRRGRRGRRGEQGDLLQVLAPSSLRREPPCRHFGVCGGCTMQHVSESEALRIKSEPHYDTLRRFFPKADYEPPVMSPLRFAYRTKVELTFLQQRDGTTTLGFHKRGKFDKGVDLGRCWLSPLPASLLSNLKRWMAEHEFSGWNPRTHEGNLRYLLYRNSSTTQDSLVAIVVNGASSPNQLAMDQLVALLKAESVSGALLLEQSSIAGAVKPDQIRHLYGRQTLVEKLGDLEFELGWQSFFQVNPPAYQKLLDTMTQWRTTPPGERVLDLFCGVGSIGLSLYQSGDQLTGVELVEQAVVDARKNAERNGIPAHFEVRSAEDWDNFETDLLIIDPPRAGCHPKLVRLLSERAPANELFYVSCNPHRLSEELEQLSTRYRLVRAQAFDFFPQTHHCELLLHFLRH